jgi:hypothetical protein
VIVPVLLLICGLLVGCQDNALERQSNNQESELAGDFNKDSDPEADDSAGSERVSAPKAITGAYLVCHMIEDQPDEMAKTVGCRAEQDGQPVSGFADRVQDISWQTSAQGSAVTITEVTEGQPPGWLKVYTVKADPDSVLSEVTIELAFTFDGQTTSITTKLALVWNEDCALPPIDFENLQSQNLTIGATISDQFMMSHGVQFSTLSGEPVMLAGYGVASPVAYFGGPENVENFLAPNQNAGQFFITDGHKQAEMTETMVIQYAEPTHEASMDLVDIDFSETYTLQAFDVQDQLVDEVQIASPIDNYRDGQMTKFIVRSADGQPTIHKLQISGFNPPGANGIGFGVDNFSPRCAR